jgi:hypothetical protein
MVLALCCTAFAGDIPNPVFAPPTRPASTSTDTVIDVQEPTTDGELETGVLNVFTEVLLNLLALS